MVASWFDKFKEFTNIITSEPEKKDAEKKAVESDITIDFTKNPDSTKNKGTVKGDAIPLTKNQALTDEDMGLSLQRTTQNPAQATTVASANKKPSTTKTSATSAQKTTTGKPSPTSDAANDPVWAQNKKNGPSLDETVNKFFGGKYANASEEEKEKMIARYFMWLSQGSSESKTSQLRQFELYKERCTNPEEYTRLCNVISKLDEAIQQKAARSVTTQGTEHQRHIGRKAVLEQMPKLSDMVKQGISKDFAEQVINASMEERIKMVDQFSEYASKDKTVADMAATHALDISENKEYDEATRIKYGQKGAEAIKYTDVDKQLTHVERAFQSEFQDVLNTTAGEIKFLDKTVQTSAIDLGLQIDNEEVANIFAKDSYAYDEENQTAIIEKLQNSKFDSVKETLATAKAEHEALEKAKAETEQKSVNTTKETQNPKKEAPTTQVADNTKKTNTEIITKRYSEPEKTTDTQQTTPRTALWNNFTQTSRPHIEVQNLSIKHALSEKKNIQEKAEYFKTLNPDEKDVAIKDLCNNATPQQLRALVMNGLGTEVVMQLTSNLTADSKIALNYLRQYLNANDVKLLNEQLAKEKSENPFENNA